MDRKDLHGVSSAAGREDAFGANESSSEEETIIEQIPGMRSWRTRWAGFCSEHGQWWSHVGSNSPIYTIPQAVTDGLRHACPSAKLFRARKSLLSTQEGTAEHAFLAVCEGHAPDVVGVWNGCPIHYAPFARAAIPQVPQEVMRKLKWDAFGPLDTFNASGPEAAKKSDVVRHQQVGYAGSLTFDRNYQAEKAALRERWASLAQLLPWPLRANTHEQSPVPGAAVAAALALPEEAARFVEGMGQFLRKWKLAQMVTWDLPLPQGPLAGVPLGLARHVLGPEQIVDAYPTYYDIPSNTPVREDIRDQQRLAAKRAGIGTEHPLTDISARKDRPSTPEAAFRMWFVERTVRHRYGARRGLVARLDSAFAAIFGITIERVRELAQTLLHLS